jgi:hypothetical protein
LFDLLVVGYGLIETFFRDSGVDLSFLRSLRVLKVAKAMKVFRGLSFVDDLRIMIDSLLGCIFKFMWSCVMIAFIMYIFALLFVQSASRYLIEKGDNVDGHEEALLTENLGSVEAGLFTLYKVISGATGWFTLYEVVKPTGIVASLTMVFFKSFWMIAVMNIVTTVFLGSVMKYATPSLREQLKAKLKQNHVDAKELTALFKDFDADGSTHMSAEELSSCASNQEVHDFFAMRGLDIKDSALFTAMLLERVEKVMAESSEETTQIELLAEECFKLRGAATTLDVELLGYRL